MKKLLSAAATSLLALSLVACGSSSADKAAQSSSNSPQSSAATTSVTSCKTDLTFDKVPDTVVLMDTTDASILADLDLLDHVKYRAGIVREGVFDKSVEDKIKAIPELKGSPLETGGVSLSTETLLDVSPDLVIGYPAGVDTDQLAANNIPLYSPDALCEGYSDRVKVADFGLVDKEIDKIAAIFHVSDKAAKLKEESKNDLDSITKIEGNPTAAALYITPGDKVFYAYGTSSMVQPILEANGLSNSYSDMTDRVFDASMEDLLKRNPEWVVLLPDSGSDQEAIDTFLGFPGASQLTAVAEKKIVVMPFPLTDPPTTLSYQGAKVLSEKLNG